MIRLPDPIDTDLKKITQARHHDPFSIQGRHHYGDHVAVRTYIPSAIEVMIAEDERPMERIPDTDIFEWGGRTGTCRNTIA